MTGQRLTDCDTRQSGFTLIEVLVALTLMALVGGMLLASFRLFAQGWDKRMRAASENDMVVRAFDIVRRDIRGLQRIVHETNNKKKFLFEGTRQSLSLIALEPPYPTQSGLYLIQYRVEQDGDKTVLKRSRYPYHPEMSLSSRQSGLPPVTMIEGPFSIQFSYLDQQNQDAKWHASWSDGSRLPISISLQVKASGAQNSSYAPLIARPYVDAEVDCIKKKSKLCTVKNDGALKASTSEKQKKSL